MIVAISSVAIKRRLAVKYHPDKNKGDKTANDRFMEINDAHQVLSDPQKREKYDQFGADWKNYEATGKDGAHQGGFDWSKYAADSHSRTARRQGMNADQFESIFAVPNTFWENTMILTAYAFVENLFPYETLLVDTRSNAS